MRDAAIRRQTHHPGLLVDQRQLQPAQVRGVADIHRTLEDVPEPGQHVPCARAYDIDRARVARTVLMAAVSSQKGASDVAMAVKRAIRDCQRWPSERWHSCGRSLFGD